jgi:hypothetical protein
VTLRPESQAAEEEEEDNGGGREIYSELAVKEEEELSELGREEFILGR